jgi:hypothetical protein
VQKEYLEFHRNGVTGIVHDYLGAELYRGAQISRRKWKSRDKGHRAEIAAFVGAVTTGAPTPIPEEESILSSFVTLEAARSIAQGRAIAITTP